MSKAKAKATPQMRILERSSDGWVTAVICGRWVQAKVYDEPSDYGLNGSRVSKIAIAKTDTHDPTRPFFEQICFNYDRGLDFNDASMVLAKKIVAQLETLPKIFG